jgi:TPR repeat protein
LVLAAALLVPDVGSAQQALETRVKLAQARQEQRIALRVLSAVEVAPASTTRLPIQITPAGAAGSNSFIRIRGLPPTAILSDGHAVGPGSWAVPLNALANLSIILPAGAQGSSEVTITLVDLDGHVLAEAKTSLVTASRAPAPREVASAAGVTALIPGAPTMSPAEREAALKVHAKGQQQLDSGNVYAARKYFERGVEAGLPESAVALAATYDPAELSKLPIVGLRPDVQIARTWYEKARELGAPEAAERLRRLEALR